jgi:hypothetical protein
MSNREAAIEALKKINIQINAAENAPSAETMRSLLSTGRDSEGRSTGPLLAFRRATGQCVDAATYLAAMAPGERKLRPEDVDVHLYGEHRAVVFCSVEAGGRQIHNIRLFVRDDAQKQDWTILAWANEPAGT